MEVKFNKNERGFFCKIQGKISFPERSNKIALNTSDNFEVEISGQNPAKTVNFLKIICNVSERERQEKAEKEKLQIKKDKLEFETFVSTLTEEEKALISELISDIREDNYSRAWMYRPEALRRLIVSKKEMISAQKASKQFVPILKKALEESTPEPQYERVMEYPKMLSIDLLKVSKADVIGSTPKFIKGKWGGVIQEDQHDHYTLLIRIEGTDIKAYKVRCRYEKGEDWDEYENISIPEELVSEVKKKAEEFFSAKKEFKEVEGKNKIILEINEAKKEKWLQEAIGNKFIGKIIIENDRIYFNEKEVYPANFDDLTYIIEMPDDY
ncbi:MAG: hypothetical protein HQK79_20405 [Desulfobacterales bacterium]|nr:hypothetical protein [Desulfobacterales bacterium]